MLRYIKLTTSRPFITDIMDVISVLDNSESLKESGCTCGLKLGLETLSSKDVEESTALEQKHKLVNQPITFLGSNSNSHENCTIKDKIEELRDKIGEYYFDKENKLIAIPNQIDLPKKPFILNPEETDKKKQNLNRAYIDEDCENKLHLEIIKVARKMKEHVFVMKGFHSEDCLRSEMAKGKTVRSNNKCQCKAKIKCTCGKAKYPELNDNEKNVMDILDIKDIEKTRLERCAELFDNMKVTEAENSKVLTNSAISETVEITSKDRRQEVVCPDVIFLKKG